MKLTLNNVLSYTQAVCKFSQNSRSEKNNPTEIRSDKINSRAGKSLPNFCRHHYT